MTETQQSVSKWANETFGLVHDPMTTAARAVEEIQEFLKLYENYPKNWCDADTEKLKEEAADIIIVLYRFVGDHIERKMRINRLRKWRLTNAGHGYHI